MTATHLKDVPLLFFTLFNQSTKLRDGINILHKILESIRQGLKTSSYTDKRYSIHC